jgi:hypothetical protein
MKTTYLLSFIALFLVGSLASSAQTQFTGWLASFNTIKTGDKTSLHTDVQLRSTDEWKKAQTFLFRPGINFHLNKTITLSAGYAYISNRRTISNVSGYATEHRIWQQLLINHKLKNIFINHRFRTEQRFIEKSVVVNNLLENDGSVTAHRFRYFIRNILPLKKETSFTKGAFAALQNEVFVNIGNNDNVNGEFFDQNRLYIAGGYRLNAKTDLEIGYMNQYVNGTGSQKTRNHILQLAGYLRL